MAKTVEVVADLTLTLDGDQVHVTNDNSGALVFHFPSKKTLGKFLRTRFALDASFSSLNRINKRLQREQQVVVLRVKDEDWMVLGRYENPRVRYNKIAPVILSKNISENRSSWYVAASVVGGGLIAALLYRLLKRQS